MLQILKSMLWVIVLVYLGFGVWITVSARNIIYYPDYPTRSDFYDCPAFDDSEKMDIKATRAYYKHVGEKIVVVYHGNAGSACDREYLKSVFDSLGYSYIFVEYAGYGGNGKNPSRKLLLKDAENIISFLKTKKYTGTVLFTESIGSGVASFHASLLPPDKMFFIAPFDSLVNVARSHYPVYPISLMAKFLDENYNNVPLLQEYNGGLLIIHGTKDNIIPFQRGEMLFEKVPTEDKRLVAIKGAGHNDIYNFEETKKAMIDFLK